MLRRGARAVLGLWRSVAPMMRRSASRAFQRLRISPTAAIMYQHKPYGFLSPSSAPEGNKVFALDLLTRSNNSCGKWQRDEDPRDLPGLRAAGRLDADSTGLMLWSTDKNLVEYIIGQSSSVEKEYLVRLSGHEHWTPRQLDETVEQLREGMHLDGRPLKSTSIHRLNEEQFRITLTEGRHRQIRRMCALVGLKVEAIKRVRIGRLLLKGLKVGCWVSLKPKQASSLFQDRPWETPEALAKAKHAERYAPVRFGPASSSGQAEGGGAAST